MASLRERWDLPQRGASPARTVSRPILSSCLYVYFVYLKCVAKNNSRHDHQGRRLNVRFSGVVHGVNFCDSVYLSGHDSPPSRPCDRISISTRTVLHDERHEESNVHLAR